MAKQFTQISEGLAAFIGRQPIFFVATAAPQGRVNLSPKGQDTFRVLGPNQVAFLNLTGSGNETAAHLKADGRITFMFCSFDAEPLILRLYGRGRAIKPGQPEWNGLISRFPALPGARQVVMADIDLVQTSCGWAVPLMELNAPRDKLAKWAVEQGEAGVRQYWRERNSVSLDGLDTGVGD